MVVVRPVKYRAAKSIVVRNSSDWKASSSHPKDLTLVAPANKDIVCTPHSSLCSSSRGLCQVYVLVGAPTHLKRPRINPRAICMYDSQKMDKEIDRIELEAQHTKYHNRSVILSGKPLRLTCTFFMGVPTSAGKRTDREGMYHIYKPDLSNLIKYIEDISVGILIEDDNLISELYAVKKYSSFSHTEFKYEII